MLIFVNISVPVINELLKASNEDTGTIGFRGFIIYGKTNKIQRVFKNN